MDKLLERAYAATGEVLAAIPADRWAAPTPCAEWTVRDVANHLVGALRAFAGAVEGETVEMDDDHLGDDPAGAYRSAAARCLRVFADERVLEAEHPFPFGPTPGRMIANISMSEALVHGWDLASGAGVPYAPDAAVVDALVALAAAEDEPPPPGMYAPPVPAPPDAAPLTVLLARLGRVA